MFAPSDRTATANGTVQEKWVLAMGRGTLKDPLAGSSARRNVAYKRERFLPAVSGSSAIRPSNSAFLFLSRFKAYSEASLWWNEFLEVRGGMIEYEFQFLVWVICMPDSVLCRRPYTPFHKEPNKQMGFFSWDEVTILRYQKKKAYSLFPLSVGRVILWKVNDYS